jgi:hypothetical protein
VKKKFLEINKWRGTAETVPQSSEVTDTLKQASSMKTFEHNIIFVRILLDGGCVLTVKVI